MGCVCVGGGGDLAAPSCRQRQRVVWGRIRSPLLPACGAGGEFAASPLAVVHVRWTDVSTPVVPVSSSTNKLNEERIFDDPTHIKAYAGDDPPMNEALHIMPKPRMALFQVGEDDVPHGDLKTEKWAIDVCSDITLLSPRTMHYGNCSNNQKSIAVGSHKRVLQFGAPSCHDSLCTEKENMVAGVVKAFTVSNLCIKDKILESMLEPRTALFQVGEDDEIIKSILLCTMKILANIP